METLQVITSTATFIAVILLVVEYYRLGKKYKAAKAEAAKLRKQIREMQN